MRGAIPVALFLLAGACGPSRSEDGRDIQALLHARFDRAEAVLDAGPVVVAGDAAVADWTQGDMGGRALLQRRKGTWHLVLCGGEALRQVEGLQRAGLAADVAEDLKRQLAAAEAGIAPARLAKLDGFPGIRPMEDAR